MKFNNRLGRVEVAGWRVALAAMLLGVAAAQALLPATAVASPAMSTAASAASRYLNLHQCAYQVDGDTIISVLPTSVGGTNIASVPERGVNCQPGYGPGWSGVIALDLTAGRYLNLHQCAYRNVYNGDLVVTVLPTGTVGGTNIANVPERGVNCNAGYVPEASGVIALDLTAGRYLNLHLCTYRIPSTNVTIDTVLRSSAGGTNVANVPERGVNCNAGYIPARSGVVALDLRR